MKKNRLYSKLFRQPRTTQERKQNQDGWGRPKRNMHGLVDAWDDVCVHFDNCWKDKRKTQYRNRGKKHTVYLKCQLKKSRLGCEWKIYQLKMWFEEHDIPFKIEEKRKQVTIQIQFSDGLKPYRSYQIEGYYVTWWSDKDVGLEYELNRFYNNRYLSRKKINEFRRKN